MGHSAIRDYFHLYIVSAQKAIPAELYIVFIVVLCFAVILSFSVGSKKKGVRAVLVVVLAETIALIYSYTVFFRSYTINSRINLIPFWSYNLESKDLQYSMFVENTTNVLMFIPLGILLGCTFRDMVWKKMLFIAICLSTSIEILQFLLHRGFTEVDDVIHNALGAVIGFCLYKTIAYIVYHIRYCKRKESKEVQ